MFYLLSPDRVAAACDLVGSFLPPDYHARWPSGLALHVVLFFRTVTIGTLCLICRRPGREEGVPFLTVSLSPSLLGILLAVRRVELYFFAGGGFLGLRDTPVVV